MLTVSLLSLLTACGSSVDSADSGSGDTDADTDADADTDTDSDADADSDSDADSDADADAGGGELDGDYGGDPILPPQAGIWIGKPGNASETDGGPFVYIFSGPVTCDDLSARSGWLGTLPEGTQVLEMLIGTTDIGSDVPTSGHAGRDVAEVNYAIAKDGDESRATSGFVTLTDYAEGDSVEGSIDAEFESGSVSGTFRAIWCADGREF